MKIRTLILLLMVCSLFGIGAVSDAFASGNLCVFISGGDNPSKNWVDFYDDIKKAQDTVEKRQGCKKVLIFAASGDPHAKDVLKGLTPDGIPILVTPSFKTEKASIATIQEKIAQTVSKMKEAGTWDDQGSSFIYVTDHGGEGKVALWREDGTIKDFRTIASLIPGNKVFMHDHCKSASMLEAYLDPQGRPIAGTCGFSSSMADEWSYADDGILRDLKPTESLNDHTHSMISNLKNHLSIPMRSSEVYLNRYLNRPSKPTVLPGILGTWSDATEQASCQADQDEFKQIESFVAKASYTLIQARLQSWKSSYIGKSPEQISLTLAELRASILEYQSKVEGQFDRRSDLYAKLDRLAVDYLRTETPSQYRLYQEYLASNKAKSSAQYQKMINVLESYACAHSGFRKSMEVKKTCSDLEQIDLRLETAIEKYKSKRSQLVQFQSWAAVITMFKNQDRQALQDINQILERRMGVDAPKKSSFKERWGVKLARIFQISAVVSLVLFTHAQSVEAAHSRCTITVEWQRKSGAQMSRSYLNDASSRPECEKAARLHEENYAPQSVQKKTVRWIWSEK